MIPSGDPDLDFILFTASVRLISMGTEYKGGGKKAAWKLFVLQQEIRFEAGGGDRIWKEDRKGEECH